MKIDVFKNTDRAKIVELEGSIHDLDIHETDCIFNDAISVVCQIKRDGVYTRIEGVVTATATFECSRCLDTYTQKVEGNFTIVARQLKIGEAIPDSAEEDTNEIDSFIYLEHNEFTLDITEYVHDAFLLALPLKPVCRENCKGLCPVCGTNLNEHECNCHRKLVDPRWYVLSDLFNKSE
jgi:uncharacterized protein